MLTIGCHLSMSSGYLSMAKDAVTIGANTFQFFTRNPRGGKAKALDMNDINSFRAYCTQYGIDKILAHAPYTMNICSADSGIREFAKKMMADDLRRMEYTPGNYYNFHPGSHVNQGVQTGIHFIVDTLNGLISEEQTTTVLLETMAGKGSEIGRCFEEISEIINAVEHRDKIGVCLDTCHIWDGGYDICNHLNAVIDEFDRLIGIGKLKAIHLNDSKNPLGSHKDRHECIGKGYIGFEALMRVVNHPVLKNLPFYLETPQPDLNGYRDEISIIRDNFIED
ncbi:deoxyribonuclease IV [Succinimonas amylolytica]|uniref:deoxyribonuclease IV n=1 Tax=Succinimonas amylolytica TaxID=83769 RepID=UPI000477224A|nr:deoxyribonuclease IV [Succinimonas amylolytica]